MGEDGEWEAPMKDNPAYKGQWYVKRITNPAYKGLWEAKKIANPEYVDDDGVYKYDDFSFIGFDLWQVKGGTIFDNVILTTTWPRPTPSPRSEGAQRGREGREEEGGGRQGRGDRR